MLYYPQMKSQSQGGFMTSNQDGAVMAEHARVVSVPNSAKARMFLDALAPDHANLDKYQLLDRIFDHSAVWQMQATLRKWDDPNDKISALLQAGAPLDTVRAPDEVIEGAVNLAMYGGASCLWECLIGNGTATAGQVLTYFSNARAAIGTGDSATAAAATQTDLQAVAGSTHQFRQPMDATYPLHTDGVVIGAASIVFRSTFASADGNFAWSEWAVFNSSTAATGRMLQRKVEALGTKVAGASWQLTVTLSLA